TTPAASANGSTQIDLASRARPPANANANGRKPAARRDWESETALEKRVNSSGISINARTATTPPSKNAPQRRFAANPANGTSARGAPATAPVGPGTSAASRNRWSEYTTSSSPYFASVAVWRRSLGFTESVSLTSGRSHSTAIPTGTSPAASASPERFQS